MDAQQLQDTFTVREMVHLLRRVTDGQTGDYARMDKGAIAEKIASFGVDKVADSIAACGLSAKNVVTIRKTDIEHTAQAQATDAVDAALGANEDAVSRILALPFPQLRVKLGTLLADAAKPAVEKIVYKDKIVEKIVTKAADGTQHSVEVARSVNEPRVIATKTVKELFGVTVKGLDGKPLQVQVWDAQDTPAVDPNYIWDAEILGDVLVSLQNGRPVWCAGPRGTGKTMFWKNLAGKLGRPFVRVSFDGGLEKQDIIGGDIAKRGDVVYRKGIILQAIARPGTIILLDEVSFARAEHVASLHALTEEDGSLTVNETGEHLVPAEGVIWAVADNTAGHGDRSGTYKDTKRMNSAFLDRFGATVRFDYMPVGVEAKLLNKKTGIPMPVADHLCSFFKTMRTSASTGDIDSPPSLRQLIYWSELLMGGRGVKQSFINVVVNKADEDSHEALMQLFNAGINVDLVQRGLRGETVEASALPEGANGHEVRITAWGDMDKISSIKIVRSVTGWSLKQAKDFVDGDLRTPIYLGTDEAKAKALQQLLNNAGVGASYRPASKGAAVASSLEQGIRDMAEEQL
jgi:cobaltochelatase CobS